jgi:hypothetical protein
MPDTQSDILARGRVFIQALMSGSAPLPLLSACAVAGNGWQENLLRPLTLGAKDHGSDGVMQWRLSRLTELERLPNWNTLQVQAQFFKAECQRDYPRLWADLVAGKKSLETLTANVMVQYERPNLAAAALDRRITYAHALLDHMDTLPKVVPTPSPAAPNIAAASVGGALVALAPLLQYLLKDVQPSHILMTVGTGIVMLIASLVMNRRPPVLIPAAIPEVPDPVVEPIAVPDTTTTPTPIQSTLSSFEQLKVLMAQRAAIDAKIAQLQPAVQAMVAEIADLLGKIKIPAQH